MRIAYIVKQCLIEKASYQDDRRRHPLPSCPLFEQLRVRAGAHKDDLLVRSAAFQAIDQQEVAADVAFAMIGPVTGERMIAPLGPERAVIGDQQQHCLLELLQIEAAGMREPRPVLGERPRVIGRAWQRRAFSARRLLRAHGSTRRHC